MAKRRAKKAGQAKAIAAAPAAIAEPTERAEPAPAEAAEPPAPDSGEAPQIQVRAADDVAGVWRLPGESKALIVQRVRADAAPHVWPAVRRFFEAACAHSGGRLNTVWAAQRIADGDQLWAITDEDGAPRGAFITHIGLYPTGLKCLEVVIGGGAKLGRASAQAVMQTLHVYRQIQGCDRIEAYGRSAIARWLGAGGALRVTGVAMEFV